MIWSAPGLLFICSVQITYPPGTNPIVVQDRTDDGFHTRRMYPNGDQAVIVGKTAIMKRGPLDKSVW
jgi:hypothetical protein